MPPWVSGNERHHMDNLGLLKPPLKVPTHVAMLLLLLLTSRHGVYLVAIKSILRLSFKMLWTDQYEINNNFMNIDSSVLRTSSCIQSALWPIFLTDRCPNHSSSFNRVVTLLLNLENHCLLSKSQFQQSESFHWISTQFKAKFYADMPFFHVCNFLSSMKSQIKHMLILNWTTICATYLFQAGNESADSSVYTEL